jgi:DNA polymerase V
MDEELKLTSKPIHAGFPNAADEAVFNKLNIHTLLIKSPSSTYFMRLEGSLGDKSYKCTRTLLVVDRGLEIRSGDVAVFDIRGRLVVKVYKSIRGRDWILPLNGLGRNIELTDEEDIAVWGVVVHIVESMRQS